MSRIVSVLFVLLFAARASAQSSPVLPKWDVTVLTGLHLDHPVDLPETSTYEDWLHAGTLGITAGRYLTEHLKLEGEVTINGEDGRYVQHTIEVPGIGLRPGGSEQRVRSNGVSGAVVWQFFENQWAHPFVFGGAALDVDRTRLRSFPQVYYIGDPRVPGSEFVMSEDRVTDRGTAQRLRAIVGAGVKLYITPRTFFRTDARGGFGGDGSGHLAFRLGFGVDF